MEGIKTTMMVAIIMLLLVPGAVALRHRVGENTGWTFPPNPGFYAGWARGTVFQVGDTLEFNYISGAHNVLQVRKTDYDSCNTASPIATIDDHTASDVGLRAAGTYYFICGLRGHCDAGMKLELAVSG